MHAMCVCVCCRIANEISAETLAVFSRPEIRTNDVDDKPLPSSPRDPGAQTIRFLNTFFEYVFLRESCGNYVSTNGTDRNINNH